MKNLSFVLFISIFFAFTFISCKSALEKKKDDLPTFTNVSESAGFANLSGLGATASWADYDSDGYQDLIISYTHRRTDDFLLLFNNNKDGSFSKVELNTEMREQKIASTSWADYNNDELLDLAAGTIRSGAPPVLYQNLGDGTFQGVSEQSGITVENGSLRHSLWVDYNNDGFVDLFQVNTGISNLYKNNGDGTFSEVSKEVGLGEFSGTQTAVWFDFNNDGFMDVFRGNREIRRFSAKGTNRLFANMGGEKFVDVTQKAGLEGDNSWNTVSACTGDFNNDGFTDLYIGNIASERNALYRNNGDGTFSDITEKTATGDIGDARTCAFIDVNSDGLIDLFTTNHLNPTKFFVNLGNESFEDLAPDMGIDKPIDVFSATWGDYDNNGTLDVFLNGHLGEALMKNSGNNFNNLILKLHGDGETVNKSAIGAKVVVNGSEIQVREVSGGRGLCEQDMLPLHFGVGKDNNIDILVNWTDTETCEFKDVSIQKNSRFKIEQKGCSISKM